MLCEALEWWDREGGRVKQEGGNIRIYICIWLIHFVVQQKLTQYCDFNKDLSKKIKLESEQNVRKWRQRE